MSHDHSDSHANNHDWDKLSRWHDDMTSAEPGEFPVFAVFLVSGEDREAHDVFRAFRTSFEKRGAGFQNLVIFGQHGISETVGDLLPRLGMSPDAIPSLALFGHRYAESVQILPLTHGDPDPEKDTENQPWRKVLNQVEEAIDSQGQALDLASLQGTVRCETVQGPVVELVEKLLAERP